MVEDIHCGQSYKTVIKCHEAIVINLTYHPVLGLPVRFPEFRSATPRICHSQDPSLPGSATPRTRRPKDPPLPGSTTPRVRHYQGAPLYLVFEHFDPVGLSILPNP